MQPPDELMVAEFLPAMRQLVARELSRQGFSQSKISSMLHVTQPSVSLYLRAHDERSISTLLAFSLAEGDALSYASLLAEDAKRNAADAVGTMCTLWTGLLGKGAVCARHRSIYPELADCDVCMKIYRKDASAFSDAVSQVAEAVRLLESSKDFSAVMPEVSVNIALAVGDARSPSDVVAVPGRIVKVWGRPKASLPPEPGASTHLSEVLLLVMRSRPAIRACINLRYDARMGRVLTRSGLKPLFVRSSPGSSSEDRTVRALRGRLSAVSGDFDVLVDLGGRGVEPNLYVFAGDAISVAKLALELARSHSIR